MNLPQQLLAQVGVIKGSLDPPDGDCGVRIPRSKKFRSELNAILNSN
jgi:hypothetical protein